VSGPTDKGCGGVDWRIYWDLPSAAGRDGWVIQEVTDTFDVKDAAGKSTFKKVYHFWEAWPVSKGKSITQLQDNTATGYDNSYDDGYMISSFPGTKGELSIVGKAKFFEGDLPSDFKQKNPDTIAGNLYSTTTKPGFWDGSGVDHNITATWDCTKTPATSKVVTVP
jgi:hypothetical protein